MPRDNLLSSACLELFALINKEEHRSLIKHLVESYREKIMALAYMDTFREILNRYDQTQGFTATVDPYFLESEDELRRPTNPAARGLMGEQLAIDPAQEEYWNTSDDEEENPTRATPEQGASSNGTATPKPLVEYTSDEEAEDNGDAVMTPAASLSPDDAFKENKEPSPSTPPSGTVTPPERLSEKRRREEEDDDALDKLVQHKRRNSNASASNSAHSAAALRKKKSFGNGGGGNPLVTPKKLAITISSNIKNAAVKASGEEEK